MTQMDLRTKRNRHRLMVAKGYGCTDLWLPRGRRVGEGRKDWEFGINRCKALYIEWINNKVLLH